MQRLILLPLFALLFAVSNAEELENPKDAHVMCAAVNAIIATKMELGTAADAIKYEAQRHANLARNYGANDNDLDQSLRTIQTAYNNGEWSWNKITNLGHACSRIK